MTVLFWKSQVESTFVASSGEVNARFDAFELEAVEGCLWLFRNDSIVCCIRGDGGIDKLHRYAVRIDRLGATNLGASVFPKSIQFRKQDEAPSGADSLRGGEHG